MSYKDAMPWEDYQQSCFSTPATTAGKWDEHRVAVITDIIGTGKTVLDIGSAGGAISEEVRKKGNEVWILDSEAAIETAREANPKLNTMVGSALDIPTEDQFDVVLVSELIEHIIDIDRLFSEIKRVMKDDGILVITTPNCSRLRNIVELLKGIWTRGFDYMYDNPIHIRFFTPFTFGKTLKDHGFKIVQIAGAYTPAGLCDWAGITKEERAVIENVYSRFRENYPIKVEENGKLVVLNADLTVFVCEKNGEKI